MTNRDAEMDEHLYVLESQAVRTFFAVKVCSFFPLAESPPGTADELSLETGCGRTEVFAIGLVTYTKSVRCPVRNAAESVSPAAIRLLQTSVDALPDHKPISKNPPLPIRCLSHVTVVRKTAVEIIPDVTGPFKKLRLAPTVGCELCSSGRSAECPVIGRFSVTCNRSESRFVVPFDDVSNCECGGCPRVAVR